MATINGTNGNDILIGGAANDSIHGKAGDDMIDGGAGNDTIDAGSGNDTVAGNLGNDSIDGGTGNDILMGDFSSVVFENSSSTATSLPGLGGTTTPIFSVIPLSFASILTGGSMNYQLFNWDNELFTNMPLTPTTTDPALSLVGSGTTTDFNNAQNLAATSPSTSNFETYAVRLTGALNITQAGWYIFSTTSDDGSQLFIDLNNDGDYIDAGELVVNNDGLHGTQTEQGAVYLAAGSYNIASTFYEQGFGEQYTLGVSMAASSIFGNDTISGGSGNDILIGDVKDYTMNAIASTSPVSLNNGSYVFGSNTLNDASGNDIFIGNVKTLNTSVTGGLSNGQALNADMNNNIFLFGPNVLNVGSSNGNNVLVGNVQNMSVTASSISTPYTFSSLLVGGSMTYNVYNYAGFPATPTPLITDGVLSLDPTSAGLSSSIAMGTVTNFNQDLSKIFYTFPQDNFAELFNGQINITEAGFYTFFTNSDDGSNLFIDSTLVVDNYNYQGPTTHTGTIFLTTGIHNIGVAYFQGGFGDVLNFGVIAPTPGSASFQGNLYSYAGNFLTAGNGNDFIYGSMQTLTLTAGSEIQGGGSSVNDNTFSFGANTLKGNDGNDLMVGNVGTITMSVIGGKNVGASMNGNSVTFGGDSIDGGRGNDKLYGDVESISIMDRGGIVDNGQFNEVPFRFNTLSFGADKLVGGNDNDMLYGDVGSMEMLAKGGVSTEGAFNAVFQDNTLSFGADSLDGGSGDDSLFGDVGVMKLTAQGGEAIGSNAQVISFFVYSGTNIFTFGNDSLNGEDGNDKLVGDVGDMAISVIGGTASNGYANGQFFNNILTFGNDTLNAGAGNDKLYGDVEKMMILVQGGTSSAGSAYGFFVGNSSIFGADALNGGAGNDKLVGDVGTMILTSQGGEATGPSADASAYLQQGNHFTFGADSLNGGDGNDMLYGDVEGMTILVQGGASSGGIAHSEFSFGNTFTFGNDILNAGSGTNQLLVGDIGTLTISIQIGSGIGDANAFFNSTTFTLGNDTLSAVDSSGINTMYGDIQIVNFTNNGGFAGSNTIQLGNNILIAGSGNDTMYASSALHALDSFIAEGNTVNGGFNDLRVSTGNAILYGGYGTNYVDFVNATGGVNYTVGSTSFNGHSVHIGIITLHDMNSVIGSNYADTLAGGSGDNFLMGGKGNDILIGIGGIDTAVLSGSVTDYSYTSSGGNLIVHDNVAGRDGTDTLIGISHLQFGGMYGTAYDLVFGAPGNNTLYGDASTQTLTLEPPPIMTIGDDGFINANIFQDNSAVYGNKLLVDSNGSDIVIGDVGTVNISLTGGSITDTFSNNFLVASVSLFGDVTYGSDILIANDGNDTLIGDVQMITVDIAGGTLNIAPNQSQLIDGGVFYTSTVTFGNDALSAGGGNNTLIGDLQEFDITVQGGEAHVAVMPLYDIASARVNYSFTNTIFGNDTQTVESGTNTLIGDIESYMFTLTPGTTDNANANVDALAFSNVIQFGNDTLNGGSGADTIYGDVVDLSQFASLLAADSSNTLVLGNNVLNGGAGNDVMWGAGQNLAALSGYLGGQVTQGTNTFVFSLVANDGNDTIGDFIQTNDNLEFHGVADLAAINGHISAFVDDGSGHVKVNFDTGASIIFNTIAYAGQTDILDLVGGQASHIIAVA